MEILDRYFLPNNDASAHASTICWFNDHFVYAWFSGSKEGAQDTKITLFNLHNQEDVITIGSKDSLPRWNPILAQSPIDKKLYLWTKAGVFCDRWCSFVHDITDWDLNVTEKEILHTANVIPAGLNGPVKTKPIFHKGKFYCGSSTENFYDWSAHIEEYSHNFQNCLGRSLPLSPPKRTYKDVFGSLRVSKGIIQPALFVDNSDKLCALFRSSNGHDKVFISTQKDHDNLEWHKPTEIDLLNPNSSLDVVFKDGYLYVVFNPSAVKRNELVLAKMEYNQGDLKLLDQITINNRVDSAISPESSYPYLVEHEDKLHLTYTYGRKKIEYCEIML